MDFKIEYYQDLWESEKFVLIEPRIPQKNLANELKYLDYSIYNTKTHSTVRICDDRLALAIIRKMIEAGRPILSEKPPGQYFSEIVLQQTVLANRSIEETREILRELVCLERQGSSNEELVRRFEQIRSERGW